MLLRCVLCNNGSYPHAVCLFSESYVLHLFQTDASFLPRTLATNPTRSAAMIVPSRTPLRCPVNTKDRTAAITAMETSKQIFVVPKLVLHVRTIARTKDFPSNITTSASTSMYTPKPRSSRRTPCGRTPLTESGLAAFPHPALYETNRSHLSIIYTDIYSGSYQWIAVIYHIQKFYPVVAFLLTPPI